MGVERTTYIIYGIKLNETDSKFMTDNVYEDEYEDIMLPYLEGQEKAEDFILIFDGMCDKDHFFGKCITSVNQYDDQSYIKLSSAIGDFTIANFKDFKLHYEKCFGKPYEGEDPCLILVNHYH